MPEKRHPVESVDISKSMNNRYDCLLRELFFDNGLHYSLRVPVDTFEMSDPTQTRKQELKEAIPAGRFIQNENWSLDNKCPGQ